jgi:hypothetical protein
MARELIIPSSTGRWVDLCGVVSVLAYGWLAWASHQPPVPLAGLFVVITVAWGALGIVMLRSLMAGEPIPLARVLAWGLVFRAIGLLALPILEDDFYRYLWDGRSSALTGNPYRDAPMSHFADSSIPGTFQRVLDRINNPHIPSIYPPMCQLVFVAGYWLAPGELLPLKLAFVAADLATLVLLWRLVPPGGVLLYAWCPLLIQETAFSGHPDSLGVFFMVAALFAGACGRQGIGAVVVALAVASKLFAVFILPFLLLGMRLRHLALFSVILGLAYLPFALPGASNESAGLFTFVASWEFNSTLYALVAAAAGPAIAKCIGGLTVALSIACLLWQENSRRSALSGAVPRGDLIFGVLFLVSPVVNPWYLLWLLPFVCARPSAWGIAALFAVPLSYAHGLFLPDVPAYHHPDWVRPVELAIVALGLAIDLSWPHLGSSKSSGARREKADARLGGIERATS